MTDLKKFLTKNEEGALEALGLAYSYGQIDGSHHKAWTIDQMVRALTGDNYEAFVNSYRFDTDEEAPEIETAEDVESLEEGEESTPSDDEEDLEEREELYTWDVGIAP